MKESAFGFIPFYKDEQELKVFLIHQYGSGGDMLWTFPKGRGEAGETPTETAVRELKEETGLEVGSFDENMYVSSSYTFERRGETIEKTSTYFIGYTIGMEFMIQPEEVKEAGWFSIEVAREKITFADQKTLLDEALKILDK